MIETTDDKIKRLMTTDVKSMVAKLLARENITTVRGNFETASFDLASRTLNLPLWENVTNDELDLFIGHEVSHALHTPSDACEQFNKRCKGAPFSVCNVIEDIRIERLIQAEYPGLIRSFKGGYTSLFNKNFFKLDDIDMADRCLIDRINIKAKLRDLVDVPFSDEEKPLVDKCFSANTFDEVLEACNAIYAHESVTDDDGNTLSDDEISELEELGKDLIDQMTEDEEEGDSTTSSNSDWTADGEDETDEEDDSTSNGVEPSDEDEENHTPEAGDVTDDGEEADSTEEQMLGDGAGDDVPSNLRVASQEALDKTLDADRLDKEDHGEYFNFVEPSRMDMMSAVVPYSNIRKGRLENEYWSSWAADARTIEKFKNFKATSKKFVNNLKMEFEMKKSAYQYSRATTAKTGKLDVNKIHAYKYSEDIFNSVTNLADAKSHGMVFLVDMSGSMNRVISDIYKQMVNLSLFCKAVSIPFKVYGFTNDYGKETHIAPDHCTIDFSRTQVRELISSDLKKTAFNEAIYGMFVTASLFSYNYNSVSEYEQLGGTPLADSTIILTQIIKDFQAKYKIQKTHAMILTDGEGNGLSFYNTGHSKYTGIGKLFGKTIEFGRSDFRQRRSIQRQINQHLKDVTGATLTHFFLMDQASDVYSAGYDPLTSDEKKVFSKAGIITRDGDEGYDRVFLINNRKKVNLNDSNDFSQVHTEGLSDAQLARAFVKNQTDRKSERIFVNKFVEMVA